jgi:hypothetical protein
VKALATGSEFEIDRGFDPDWTRPEVRPEAPTFAPEPIFAPAPAGSDARPEDLVPIMPFPLPEPESAFIDPPDDDVLLTEVASDADLFSDPSLEIAQLADGQTREIIVPVMLGEGMSARRFKLAIRLRLDPVE